MKIMASDWWPSWYSFPWISRRSWCPKLALCPSSPIVKHTSLHHEGLAWPKGIGSPLVVPTLSKQSTTRATCSGRSCFSLLLRDKSPRTLCKGSQLVKLDSFHALLCECDNRRRNLIGATLPHHLPYKNMHCYLHSGVTDPRDNVPMRLLYQLKFILHWFYESLLATLATKDHSWIFTCIGQVHYLVD